MSDQKSELPKAEAAPAASAPANSRRRPLQIAWLLLLLLIVAAGGLVYVTHRGALNGRVPLAAQDRLANLETRLDQLTAERGAAVTGANAGDVANLKDRLDMLESRLSTLETQVQNAPAQASPDIAARLAALEAQIGRAGDKEIESDLLARVSRLEAQNSGDTLRRAGTVLALATLARATRDGGPFRVELDALSGAAPNDPVIASLQPIADQGAPTAAMLAARFPQVVRAALDAERKAGASGFFSRLWASFASLVSIRRVGDAEGNTTSDRLARAEADLGRGDLQGAVRETEALTGAAAMAAASWLKDTQARLNVDRAVAQMDARIVQALASPESQSRTP